MTRSVLQPIEPVEPRMATCFLWELKVILAGITATQFRKVMA
jgi:hypothetical protein